MQPDLKMTLKRIEDTNALGETLCEKVRNLAREDYADLFRRSGDHSMAIDDDAQVTESDEHGFWVEARVYVLAEEAGYRMDDAGKWFAIAPDDDEYHDDDGPDYAPDNWTPTPEEIEAEMDRLESIPHPSQTLSCFMLHED